MERRNACRLLSRASITALVQSLADYVYNLQDQNLLKMIINKAFYNVKHFSIFQPVKIWPENDKENDPEKLYTDVTTDVT